MGDMTSRGAGLFSRVFRFLAGREDEALVSEAREAFDAIGKAVEHPGWVSPGQLVRDVERLAARVRRWEQDEDVVRRHRDVLSSGFLEIDFALMKVEGSRAIDKVRRVLEERNEWKAKAEKEAAFNAHVAILEQQLDAVRECFLADEMAPPPADDLPRLVKELQDAYEKSNAELCRQDKAVNERDEARQALAKTKETHARDQEACLRAIGAHAHEADGLASEWAESLLEACKRVRRENDQGFEWRTALSNEWDEWKAARESERAALHAQMTADEVRCTEATNRAYEANQALDPDGVVFDVDVVTHATRIRKERDEWKAKFEALSSAVDGLRRSISVGVNP